MIKAENVCFSKLFGMNIKSISTFIFEIPDYERKVKNVTKRRKVKIAELKGGKYTKYPYFLISLFL